MVGVRMPAAHMCRNITFNIASTIKDPPAKAYERATFARFALALDRALAPAGRARIFLSGKQFCIEHLRVSAPLCGGISREVTPDGSWLNGGVN
jgi:hypothetical protein